MMKKLEIANGLGAYGVRGQELIADQLERRTDMVGLRVGGVQEGMSELGGTTGNELA